jgi:hypothetical protein
VIATGPDDVDHRITLVLGERHDLGGGEDRVEQSRQLLGALPLRAQRDDEADQLGRRRIPGSGSSSSPRAPARR